jgi:hypothetical protein
MFNSGNLTLKEQHRSRATKKVGKCIGHGQLLRAFRDEGMTVMQNNGSLENTMKLDHTN